MTSTIPSEAVVKPLPKAPVYAVGVVRVSERGKRDDEHFKSPDEQTERINAALKPEGLELARVFPEIDVKGRWSLAKRKGLTQAIEMIEAHQAQVLVVAYFDRLCRSVAIKSEVVKRVEAAGGRVLALDFGEVTEKTAVQWFSSTMIAAVAEYLSRSVGERLGGTQKLSIKAGVPIGSVAPGYRKDPTTRRLVVDEDEAQVVREAFRMRSEGESVGAVRRHLAAGGIVRSRGAVSKLLRSRTFLGELYFGQHSNPDSHTAIVDRDVWERVQRVEKGEQFKAPPGRKSPLLLAGLRLLKCPNCGNTLVASSQVHGGKTYREYKCSRNLNCPRRVGIDARIADEGVANTVRALLKNKSVTEGLGAELGQARAALEQAQANLDQAIDNTLLIANNPRVQQRLKDLQDLRDQAADAVAVLEEKARRIGDALILNANTDWDDLTLDEQRQLVRDVIVRVVVAEAGVDASGRRLPRGASRLKITTIYDEAGEPLA